MASNNAVILLKQQTYGPIIDGETMAFKKRPYEFNELEEGDIVVQTMYLSIDPYLVSNFYYHHVDWRGEEFERIP